MRKYFILSMLILCSCGDATNPPDDKHEPYRQNLGMDFQRWFIQGHSYILYDGYRCCSMVHDPDCACHNRQEF